MSSWQPVHFSLIESSPHWAIRQRWPTRLLPPSNALAELFATKRMPHTKVATSVKVVVRIPIAIDWFRPAALAGPSALRRRSDGNRAYS